MEATEHRRAKIKKQREDWVLHHTPAIAQMPDRVVFLDETTVKINLTRQRGWAPRNERLKADVPFWKLGHANPDPGNRNRHRCDPRQPGDPPKQTGR